VNPLRLIGDVIDRVNSQPPVVYPEALGQWPAVVALAVFGWMELAWPCGSHPFDLAVVILVYLLVQITAMSLVGSDVWLERAELFTAFSRLMARVSPLEWYVVCDRPCPADLHDPGEVVGCAAWAAGEAGRARDPLARLHVGDMARPPAPARRPRDDRSAPVRRALRRVHRDDAVHRPRAVAAQELGVAAAASTTPSAGMRRRSCRSSPSTSPPTTCCTS
jgi:hypothetical protein